MPTSRQSGVAGSDGRLVLAWRVTGTQPWIVSQISVEMQTAAGGTTGAVRLSGCLVAPFVAGADAVGGDPPITLQPGGDELTVEWSGAPPGASGQVLIMYEVGS